MVRIRAAARRADLSLSKTHGPRMRRSFFPPTVTFPILKGLARINLGSLHAGGGGVTPHDGVFDQPGSPDRGTVVRLQGDPRVLDQLGAV